MVEFRTRPDGSKYPITPKGGGVKMLVGAGVLLAVVGGAGGLTLGGGAALGDSAGAAADSLPGNLAGDVADSLPGRNLSTRKAEGKKSAQRGKTDEAFSRLKLKQLKKTAKRDLEDPADTPPRFVTCCCEISVASLAEAAIHGTRDWTRERTDIRTRFCWGLPNFGVSVSREQSLRKDLSPWT